MQVAALRGYFQNITFHQISLENQFDHLFKQKKKKRAKTLDLLSKVLSSANNKYYKATNVVKMC